jgi:ABC-2 type transport system ATP-binding protein/lipopolysaccharide transport system ATP-binding protein
MSEAVATPSLTSLASTAPAVTVESISVRYRVPHERYVSLKEFAIRWAQGRLSYVDFWALREVDFQVGWGEIFGIVGPNGAGKTTLLKTIAGVLQPTEGRVIVRGERAPLLELGAGFHPELTGRENVYLYGTLLGNTRRELDAGFRGIVDFAELWEFIDAPLRTYSSGMVARLAFAVATSRLAPVLLIDEVLAVGDVHFQERCRERMAEFRGQGACVLFVSHDPALVARMCQRALWLEAGRACALGPAEEVVRAYVAASA